MKVIRLEIENYKRIKAMLIVPRGDMVEICGMNDQGKSSALDALEEVLGGKGKDKEAMEPVRQGEKQAKTFVVVGDNGDGRYEVTRVQKKDKPAYLRVKDLKAGKLVKDKPQTLLNKFLSDLTWDVMKFANSGVKEMFDLLMQVVGFDFDIEKVVDLVELSSFKPLADDGDSPLEIIDRAYQLLYDKRTDVGRDRDRLDKHAMSFEIPDGMEDVEPVSTRELVAKRQEMEEGNREREMEQRKLTACLNARDEIKERFHSIEDQIVKLEEDKKVALARIAELSNNEKQILKNIEASPHHDMAGIDNHLADTDHINEVAVNVKQKKQALKEWEGKRDVYDDMSNRLSGLQLYKKGLVSSAEFPLVDLTVSPSNVVLYRGVPVSKDSTSTSSRILIGLSIGKALNDRRKAAGKEILEVLLIRDGNDIDSENMKKVRAWAEKHKYQIWFERLKSEPDGEGFFIEDGGLVEGDIPLDVGEGRVRSLDRDKRWKVFSQKRKGL